MLLCLQTLSHVFKLKIPFHPLLSSQTLLAGIPDNAFGVFITFKTHRQEVHGCIGFWDPAFNPVSRPELHT